MKEKLKILLDEHDKKLAVKFENALKILENKKINYEAFINVVINNSIIVDYLVSQEIYNLKPFLVDYIFAPLDAFINKPRSKTKKTSQQENLIKYYFDQEMHLLPKVFHARKSYNNVADLSIIEDYIRHVLETLKEPRFLNKEERVPIIVDDVDKSLKVSAEEFISIKNEYDQVLKNLKEIGTFLKENGFGTLQNPNFLDSNLSAAVSFAAKEVKNGISSTAKEVGYEIVSAAKDLQRTVRGITSKSAQVAPAMGLAKPLSELKTMSATPSLKPSAPATYLVSHEELIQDQNTMPLQVRTIAVSFQPNPGQPNKGSLSRIKSARDSSSYRDNVAKPRSNSEIER